MLVKVWWYRERFFIPNFLTSVSAPNPPSPLPLLTLTVLTAPHGPRKKEKVPSIKSRSWLVTVRKSQNPRHWLRARPAGLGPTCYRKVQFLVTKTAPARERRHQMQCLMTKTAPARERRHLWPTCIKKYICL